MAAIGWVTSGTASYFNYKNTQLKKEDSQAKEQRSNEKIAALNAQAEALKTEAARIEAEGHERIAQVEAASNVKIEDVKSESATKIAQMNAEAEKIRGEVAQQQERAALAERALLELQERLKPRFLTVEKQKKLIEMLQLAPRGHLVVWYVSNDSEAKSFALQLATSIKEAGWIVEVQHEGTILGAGKGIHIEVKNSDNPIAGNLQRCLQAIGFQADGIINKEMSPEIRLTIGAQP